MYEPACSDSAAKVRDGWGLGRGGRRLVVAFVARPLVPDLPLAAGVCDGSAILGHRNGRCAASAISASARSIDTTKHCMTETGIQDDKYGCGHKHPPESVRIVSATPAAAIPLLHTKNEVTVESLKKGNTIETTKSTEYLVG